MSLNVIITYDIQDIDGNLDCEFTFKIDSGFSAMIIISKPFKSIPAVLAGKVLPDFRNFSKKWSLKTPPSIVTSGSNFKNENVVTSKI